MTDTEILNELKRYLSNCRMAATLAFFGGSQQVENYMEGKLSVLDDIDLFIDDLKEGKSAADHVRMMRAELESRIN